MKLLSLLIPQEPIYAQVDLKDATIKIKDGTGTPNAITIKVGEGNLTWSEKVTREYTLDRGLLDEVRDGDQVPVELSMDFVWEYIRGVVATTGTPSVEDALKKINGASAWISTDADLCRPYAVDIEITVTPNCTSGDHEIITFSDFRYEQLDHDLRAGTISMTGRCNITKPTVTRVPQSS